MTKKKKTLSRSSSAFPFLLASIFCWCALAEKFILHQCHDYHVVSFAELHLIRERNSNVESFSARQERRSFFAAASPSRKSVKGSHRGVLVVSR